MMNRREAQRLQVGDRVILKHRLGAGNVERIIREWSQGCGQPRECRFPMILYKQEFTHQLTWCTYRVIDKVVCPLRSIT